MIPVVVRDKGSWSRGDIVRVRLEIDAQADMIWVVVDDPLPAGASHLGMGLGASQVAAQDEKHERWVWTAFTERTFDAYRGYYAFIPKGHFVVEYTMRMNQSGIPQVPPTRVEALYAPEMFGERSNEVIEVNPQSDFCVALDDMIRWSHR
jgi:alpha-2-macroglobulin